LAYTLWVPEVEDSSDREVTVHTKERERGDKCAGNGREEERA
jgi:hypothetical protein